MPAIDPGVRDTLISNAAKYETAEFIQGDPSWFMHQVSGDANQEAMAFVASGLSYGSRQQFMKKIQLLLDASGGQMAAWIADGAFADILPEGGSKSFYRLYTEEHMNAFLTRYRAMLQEFGTMGQMVRGLGSKNAFDAIEAICRYFGGSSPVIPKDASSACKRVCMFLRWMVRNGSPVDLGLWADAIDRRTLIIPMDTHVLQQSARLGLISGKSTSMAAARKLTAALSEVFPDDPLKGDFALFGYGVNGGE